MSGVTPEFDILHYKWYSVIQSGLYDTKSLNLSFALK